MGTCLDRRSTEQRTLCDSCHNCLHLCQSDVPQLRTTLYVDEARNGSWECRATQYRTATLQSVL